MRTALHLPTAAPRQPWHTVPGAELGWRMPMPGPGVAPGAWMAIGFVA